MLPILCIYIHNIYIYIYTYYMCIYVNNYTISYIHYRSIRDSPPTPPHAPPPPAPLRTAPAWGGVGWGESLMGIFPHWI